MYSAINILYMAGVNVPLIHVKQCMLRVIHVVYMYMNKEKNLSPSQGLNLGLPNTSQMLLPLRHQDS